MKKQKISRRKLVIGVFLLILVFFSLIAKGTSDIISYRLQSDAFDRYQLLANDTAETINAWLSTKKEIIENQRAAIETFENFDIDHLSGFLSKAIMGRKDHGEICDLYFLDPDNVLATANGFYTDPDIDLRKREWYTKCLVTRDLFYSSPYLDVSTGNYVMTISCATHDSSGKFRGVLALDLYIDAFINIVNNARVPSDSYMFLLDKDFGVATHPYRVFGYVDCLPQRISDLPGNIYAEVEDTVMRGKFEMKKLSDYDGVTRDMFTSNISCCGWCIVAAVSDEVLHSSERLMIVYILAALFISLSVGILWTLFGSRRIMRQLADAMEAANAASETKSSFLANMSHEIRTPINAVIGMNEMIRREDISDTVRDYTTDIDVASRSLIGIINDILDFSKIESGKLEIVESEFNIASTINDVVSLSMSRLGEKPLEMIVKADPTLPASLLGDEMRIKQIIVNLMTNGIKYTNEGFVSLDVSYTKRDYGINLDVSVKDSGIGITAENIEKLFTSFQQIDTKRNRSVEGTGLGLAITKRLVERMGGFVNIESEYGTGSEFRVCIPLKVADSSPLVSIREREKIHALCLFGLSDHDVATVDEFMRGFIGMIRKTKLDMRQCVDAEEMKELISQGGINVLFVDRFNYIEHEKYLVGLIGKVRIFIVQSRLNSVKPPNGIHSIYKPFYSIPLAVALNGEEASPAAADDLSRTGFTAPKAKILIVDDNIINLKVAAGLMKPYNMTVHTADSGEKAIMMLEQSPDYNIVFMDHMMPKMDGIEAVGIIRAKGGKYYGSVPIIALTANTVNNARQLFLDNGFDEFLAKPIDTGGLDRMLRRFLPEELRVYGPKPVKPDEKAAESPVPVKAEAVPEFDPEKGKAYSGGDEELYLDILSEYARSGGKVRDELVRACIDKDWKNYIIKVHALKSTSLNIGAEPLSELAKKLELAGKAGNLDTVIRGSDELFAKLDEVLGITKTYLKEHGIDVEKEAPAQNPDISEFTEITREQFDEIVHRFINACDNFDRDTAILVSEEASGLRYGDIALCEYFSKAEKHIEEFEYYEASEVITGLKEGVK